MAIGTGTAILIGAGLAAAGSVAGGLINSHSQDKANEANKELQLQNQEYQTSERLAAESYNSPVNQSQLYEQAGFNKYLALGNMPSGETTAQTGVSPAVMKPNTAIGDMISQLGNLGNNSINQYADLSIKDAQAEQLGIDNKIRSIQAQYEGIRQVLELDKMRSEINNSNASAAEKQKSLGLIDRHMKELDVNLKYLDEYNKARNDETRNRADYTKAQEQGQLIKNDIQEKVKAFLPQLQEAQLQQMAASTFASYQSGILSHKQGILTDEMKHHEAIKAIGSGLDNLIKHGNIKLQELGLNEKEVNSIRNGLLSKTLKGNPAFKAIDGIANWLVGLPLQFFKGF